MTTLQPSGTLRIGGSDLEYRMIGPMPDKAPTIVMLHEGLGSVGLWGDFPDRLQAATGAGVFVYSRAGYGQSSPAGLPRKPDYMHAEALDVLPKLLDTIGFRRGLLLGLALILPVLDVERIVWSGFGQVGVGGSIGYSQRKARAYASAMSGGTGQLTTDVFTAFHLLPITIGASYRFTELDSRWGIPVVPYVRASLAYYAWWITDPNGNFAKVCKDGGEEPDCAQNRALGASLGVVGAVGLAIRAERIDGATAMSMRQSGIEHAGIYGELSVGRVDGFGSATKLSVGDRTWFAGVDFEF